MKVWLDGRIVDGADARIPVTDHGFLYGDGVFEGIRVYSRRVFRLEQHLARLAVSARAIGLELPGGLDRAREIILATAFAFDADDAYVRFVVSRGEGALGVDPTSCPRPRLVCIVDHIRIYPAELLAQRPSEFDQRRHKLLSRFRAHGLLGVAGQAELWLGVAPARLDPAAPERSSREVLRACLLDEGAIVQVEVDGLKGPRFVIREDLPLLDAISAGRSVGHEPGVTFVAPLDPLAWDRDLLRQLFDFDYVWEVYVPEPKRRWGYYVLPLLFGDRLVGRIEPRIDRVTRTVRILGLWWEAGFDPRRAEGLVDAMRAALRDYLAFGGATVLDWAPALNRERRLFGTHPLRRAA